MVKVEIYAEGGGNARSLRNKCREGFSKFLEKIPELKRRMPSIHACGSRREAYDDFCTALSSYPDSFCILLVDSEEAVRENLGSWELLRTRQEDQWNRPQNTTDENAHLMVQCMEAWFLADKEALANYFKQGFNSNSLSKNINIEAISKKDIYDGLKEATRQTKTKGKYGKGSHSFDILGMIDPQKVCAASPHAKRFIDTLIRIANE